MNFKPFDKMWDRVETAKQISDDAHFNQLMYMGELFTKFTVTGMVAGIDNGRERHQYRLKYRLVRADGLGEWSQILDEITVGVPNQYVVFGNNEIRQLNHHVKEGEWQYESVYLLDKCLRTIEPQNEKLPTKIQAKSWFKRFTELRNRTRGHGAPSTRKLSQITEDLEKSILVFQDNFSLFQLGWSYLKQTLKKRYHVINLNMSGSYFDFLKTHEGENHNLVEGVYIFFDQNGNDIQSIKKVDLVYTDIEISDLLLPNGKFNSKQFQIISYISDKTINEDAKPFLTPIDQLPPSETEGKKDIVDNGCITNLPQKRKGYILRRTLEESVYKELVDENEHRIITLNGRGGIGKTWLALEILNRIAQEGEFQAIFWFSARDIDLLSDGAKEVKPHILNEDDIANEFFHLIGGFFFGSEDYEQKKNNTKEKRMFLMENMTQSELGRVLFVFDNFETVQSPIELYKWIDTYLRSPNKVLITTRYREFKGDHPIELTGMRQDECRKLIDETANNLSIQGLITESDKNQIYEESEGHPYVVKILLSEIKKTGKMQKPEMIIAKKIDILDSLFERTYSRLSLPSQRIFLTLCAWKSVIAQTALEAILIRTDIDVQHAVDDLDNSSLVEVRNESDEVFLSVPLAAVKFGMRKFNISSMQEVIKYDISLLQLFGAMQQSDIKSGITPRINRLFQEITRKVHNAPNKISEFEHIIEFLARKYPYTWIRWADLYNLINKRDKAIELLIKYLEFSENEMYRTTVIRRLISYYHIQNEPREELFWRLQLSQTQDIDYETISETANRFNEFMSYNNNSRDIWYDGEKEQFLAILVQLMQNRIEEADATDCSRLGWLYAYNGQKMKAMQIAEEGLKIAPDNKHCLKLLRNLNGGGY